jgi:O-antigen/teichoic acid export membrane protein
MIVKFRNRLRSSTYWKDILWQASGNSLAQVIGILGMPLLTRLYTPHDFALQNLFLQVVGLATGLMTLRYEYFIQLPNENTDSKHLLHLVLFVGFVTLVVLTPITWFFRDMFSYWLGDTTLAPWLVFAPLTALLICYALALQHSVQRKRNYRRSGLSELVGKSSYILCGTLGSCFLLGALGLIAAPAASAIGKIACLFNLGKNRETLPGSFAKINGEKSTGFNLFSMWRLARTYAHLSGSMVFTHLMATCTATIPVVFIAHTYGQEILGQFTLVISTVGLPSSLIAVAIGQVYYQRAAERWANGESFADIRRSTAKRLILIGLPLYAGVAIISPWMYPLIFGNNWTNAGHYASVLAVSVFFSFVSAPLDRTCLIVGAWWYCIGSA